MIPLLHDFTGTTVLVVGGGRVGARKARRFAREARVVVVSPAFVDDADFGGAERVRAALDPDDWPELVYNVGANESNYRIEEIAEAIRDELNYDLDITYLEDEHPGPSYHVNFDRVANTGFDPEHDLRGGIADLADRFQNGANGVHR